MAAVTPPEPDPGPDILDSPDAAGLLVRGSVLRFAGYVATVGLSVISAAVLTRYLGVRRFGEYTTVMSLVTVVATVTDSGMSNIGTREYAILAGSARERLMRELLGLRIALTLVGIPLIVAWSLVAGYSTDLTLGAVAASLATVALVLQHTLSIPLTTDLRLGSISALELARQAFMVMGIVALAIAGGGLFALLGVSLLANLLLIPPTARLVRGRITMRPSFAISRWPALLRVTVVFSLATAAGTIYIYAAQIVTSLVTSHYQSGLFAVSFRVFVVCASLPAVVVGSALPVLSRSARDDRDRLAYVLQQIFEASLIAGVGLALAISAGGRFIVSVVAGAQYAGAAPVLSVQAFALVASFVVAGCSYGMVSLHMHRSLLAVNLAALAVSVALTAILADSDGARGAAIATICGEATLGAGSIFALGRHGRAYRPRVVPVIKVAAGAALAGATLILLSLPSLVAAIVAVILYGAVILLSRALPAEFGALLPGPLRRR